MPTDRELETLREAAQYAQVAGYVQGAANLETIHRAAVADRVTDASVEDD